MKPLNRHMQDALVALFLAGNAYAVTYTVKKDGTGNCTTIQACVEGAVAGDTIVVFGGIYRETVTFKASGTASQRITLTASPGEMVYLRGSGVVTDWTLHSGTTYKKTLTDSSFFGSYNPFRTPWPAKPVVSSGGVFINGKKLAQAASLSAATSTPMSWWADLRNPSSTTIYANIGSNPPNTFTVLRRRQVVTAEWNKGYITVRGFNIGHGSAPKDVNFYRPEKQPVDGALATHGGHHWIVEDCVFEDNHGVALDYGLGGGKYENQYGIPANRGAHIIRNNTFRNNDTNAVFAFKGSYTEIYNNTFINNNALNTGLVSEAYVKNVDEGPGIKIRDNYFYSDQSWKTKPIWLDTECQANEVAGNVFAGMGILLIEKNIGYNLVANNVFVNSSLPFMLVETSHSYFVHNLFINSTAPGIFLSDIRVKGGQGQGIGVDIDGADYVRHLFVYQPNTRNKVLSGPASFTETVTGHDYTGAYPVRFWYNRLFNNIAYQKWATVDTGLGEPLSRDNDSFGYWGNLSNYNVLYNGAAKLSDYASHRYTPDANSAVVAGNTATSSCSATACSVTFNIDASNKPSTLGAPAITGALMGTSWWVADAGYTQLMPDVNTDFYGSARNSVVVGPFGSVAAGSNTRAVWPKKINDTDDSIIYLGSGWTYTSNTGAYQGDLTRSSTAGDKVTFTFFGTAAKFYYKSGPASGPVKVTVDGVARPDLNTHAATATQQAEYSVSGLPLGYHKLELEVKTGGQYLQVDSFMSSGS